MKKKTLFSTLFTLLALLAFSQNSDQKSKDILNAVKSKYTAYKSVQLSFKYSLYDKIADMTDEQSGSVTIAKDKFRLEMDQVLLVSDNKTLWMVLKEVKQIQVQDYDPDLIEEDLGFSPNSIFNIQETDFDSRFVNEVDVNGTLCNLVEITPTDKDKPYYKAKMFISKAKNELVKTIFYEKDGVEYTVEFSGLIINKTFESSHFAVDAKNFTGYDVEDLR